MGLEAVAEATVGGESILIFDFLPQAVDELIDGVITYARPVFDVGVDRFADLVLGEDLARVSLQKI